VIATIGNRAMVWCVEMYTHAFDCTHRCHIVIFHSTSSTGVSYEQGVDFLAGYLLSQIFCFEHCIPSAEAQFVAFLSIRFPTLPLRFVLPRRFGTASVGEFSLFAYDCLVQCVNCLIEGSYSYFCVSGTCSLAHSLT
jgi:hypothetical protein